MHFLSVFSVFSVVVFEGKSKRARLRRAGFRRLWCGRDRDLDLDLGGAFQYSRRLTRLMDKSLWGLRVLKFDVAIAPRVLKFDSGFAAEGCGGRLTFIEGALL